MKFEDLVCIRRSHRRFTEEPVSENDLRSILRAALMSPTGHGARNWQFITVRDADTLAFLSTVRPAGSAFLKGAAAVVAVLGEPQAQSTWIEDGGSCWCQIRGREGTAEGKTAEDLVRERLGIPAQFAVLCLVGFGHPADERKPQDEAALKWDHVHQEGF